MHCRSWKITQITRLRPSVRCTWLGAKREQVRAIVWRSGAYHYGDAAASFSRICLLTVKAAKFATFGPVCKVHVLIGKLAPATFYFAHRAFIGLQVFQRVAIFTARLAYETSAAILFLRLCQILFFHKICTIGLLAWFSFASASV